MPDYVQILTTTEAKDDANAIARTLVEERLAACVQVIGPITSTYRWNDEIETAEEWLCLIKTSSQRYAEVEERIRAVHPYDVPEILAIPVVAGNPGYLDWLQEGVSAPGR
jgi:periplasmic divalent cation tolerance protein